MMRNKSRPADTDVGNSAPADHCVIGFDCDLCGLKGGAAPRGASEAK
jgi:hypothetical protein